MRRVSLTHRAARDRATRLADQRRPAGGDDDLHLPQRRGKPPTTWETGGWRDAW